MTSDDVMLAALRSFHQHQQPAVFFFAGADGWLSERYFTVTDSNRTNVFLEAALQYAALGFKVFPVVPRGKRPLTEHGVKDATSDVATIAGWWQRWPDANVGIACGGMLVIDVDPLEDGSENPWLGSEPGRLLKGVGCPTAITPRDGRHFYCSAAAGVALKPGTSVLAAKVDHRTGEGSYVVAAPSIGENGNCYRWEIPLDRPLDHLPPPPDSIVALLAKQNETSQKRPRAKLPKAQERNSIPEGQRNDTLASLAGTMRRTGLSTSEISAALHEANRVRCSPPLDGHEVETIAISVGRYPAHDPDSDPESFEWADPQCLPDDLPAVMPFDLELLPAVFRPWIADIAERLQCPPDYPAVAAMVGLSSIIGRKVGIRPKCQDDWLVVPNLWGMVIGRPSLMKTPAIKEPLKPINRLETEALKVFKAAEDEFIASEAVAHAKAKVTKQGITEAVRKGENALKLAMDLVQDAAVSPTRRRYLVNDSTVEKLGELLNENPNGVLLFRDELVGLLKSLDKDGQEGARTFYLESWNGNGRYTYDRIIRGTLDIEAAIVSIIGAIQPGPLQAYLRDAVRGGSGDDGLMQRFQLAVWPDVSAVWRNVDRWPDSDAKNAAWAVFQRLDQQTADDFGAERDQSDASEIPFLRLSPTSAQQQFDDWREPLEKRLRSGQDHPAIESHLGKYRSLVPSLALLIHLADTRGGLIGGESLDKAIGWATYLESHARRLYGAAVKPDISAAKALAQKIVAGELGEQFALRDVYRNGWSGLSTSEEAQKAADVLIDFDWIRRERFSTATKSGTRHFINPKVLGTPRT